MIEMSIRCKLRMKYHLQPEPLKIVIVGDRLGPTNPTYADGTPFCGSKASSVWLNNQLTIPEEDLRWINAYLPDGAETCVEELKKLLPAKTVIALGGNASKWLSKYGVEHVKTYHPQYWKRFRNKERYPLLDILEELND